MRSLSYLLPGTLLPGLFLLSAATLADDIVEGTVRLEDGEWKAVDAIAYADEDSVRVVISNTPFDRDAMAVDGVVNSFDTLDHDGNTFTVNVEADGPTMCVDFLTRTETTMRSGSNCRSEFPDAIHIESRSDSRIAGRVDIATDDGLRIELAFDVAVMGGATGGLVEAPGEPLPDDGGAPGRAVLQHFELLAAGDWVAIKENAHPEARAMMDESEQAGEHLEMLEMLKLFAPKEIRITGGSVDGDTAYVTYDASEDGAEVKGIATVVHFEGRWYFQGSSSEFVGGAGEGSVYIPPATDSASSLMQSIMMGSSEAVALLMNEGADMTERTADGRTLALLAVESGNPEIVKALLEAGADFNAAANDGTTPALTVVQGMAGSEATAEMISLMSRHGVDLDAANDTHTPLAYAVEYGDAALVTVLLDAGADPAAAAPGRRPPLFDAVVYPEIFSALLAAGASSDSTDPDGTGVIFAVLDAYRVDLLEALLAAGADANRPDAAGRTPLEVARNQYMEDAVALLTSYGAVDAVTAPAAASSDSAADVSGVVTVPALPRHAGSTPLFEQDVIAIYVTADPLDAVAASTLSLLQADGWQGGLNAETDTMKQFILGRDALELDIMVSVAPAQGNQTTIQYNLRPR